jgi:hypothetical protein
MPKGWVTIRVRLLGGAGIECEPPPGRIMLVGPRHTFADLAKAIDAAFARWDLSHLHMFELADGRRLGEPDPDWDDRVADETAHVVTSTVAPGERFQYVFDLGDDWRHECEVLEAADPMETYGTIPRDPVPSWGWGWIPDQYGRESEEPLDDTE